MKRDSLEGLLYFHVEEGVKTSCLIPLEGAQGVSLDVRSQSEVMLNALTVEGEIVPLASGKIVRWSGKVVGYVSVEIVATTGVWYSCQRSTKWYEIADPVPFKVELAVTEQDVIRSMINERLRRWEVQQEMSRPLTEEEKDELILDIAKGDLEFENEPDEYGLGYTERLEEFVKRTAEQSEPAPEVVSTEAPPAEKPGATVPPT